MSDGGLHLNINSFDAIVLAIFFLSVIVAFFRGFIRELLSLGAWIGAALFTIYCFPSSDAFVHGFIKNEKIAAGIAAISTYILALVTISIINSIILRYVKTGAEVGLLDNFLGIIFGALRGAFILSFGFLLMSAVISKSSPPLWLKTSITKPYLQQGADALVNVAPKYMLDMEVMVKTQSDHENNPQDYPPEDTSSDKTPGAVKAVPLR